MKKKIALLLAVCVATIAMASTAFAAGWEGSDAAGWKWKKDDGSYITNDWAWLDSDGDSKFESYYFDGNGICAIDTKIGEYSVNKLGQWIVDNIVQIKTGAGPGGVDKKATEKTKRTNSTWDDYASKLTYSFVDGTEDVKIYADGSRIVFDVTVPQTSSQMTPQKAKEKYYADNHYIPMQVMANDALKFFGASSEFQENIYSSDGQLLYSYTYFGCPSYK